MDKGRHVSEKMESAQRTYFKETGEAMKRGRARRHNKRIEKLSRAPVRHPENEPLLNRRIILEHLKTI